MRAVGPFRRATRTAGLALLLAVGLMVGCAGAETTGPAPDEPSTPAGVEVEVFFPNELLGDPCGEVFPVTREVDADDPLIGALAALLRGPTPDERADGYGGWFSAETAGMLRSAEVLDATVHADLDDLRPVIPGASSSCGSAALLAQLDTTALAAAPDATGTRYTIEGSAERFYAWLQLAVPGDEADAADDGDAVHADGGATPDEAVPEPEAAPADPALLEDGRHPAYLHAIDVDGRTITVDVIQFLTGQAAVEAYQADHPDDPDGPPNDYYILNVNPRLRTLPVAVDVTVELVRLHENGDADLDPATWEELPSYLALTPPDDARLSWNPHWLTVRDGQVIALEEQYLP